ncbi:MAG: aspartate aminotransferase family protein [Cytophagales bacterium]|jgi:glutamate/tyrosine decarboxylase-like PLP-dependent enzyme|nr:aspartate aminotransferase family protein [Cytophagales bacterium]MCA6366180.1 aspartate aminotransferase family protein [Cytophagales bacterium]MCA6369850.1 aspartate aminotransferase family protein [Cytophagales bacterium]MCA6374538.1 aspartate aminotransferase family protein [Cytophagales bacterium]MCA6384826.1 aspartate aminotransferase family protein [Cytophagales bacterium]
MNSLIKKESEEVSSLFELISTQSTVYLSELHERPTTSSEVPLLRTKLDQSGVGTLGALQQFNERFEALMVGSSGPRYWGFVTGGTTPAAIAGDWLSTVYDQNPQGLKGQGDVSANLEIETIQLLLDLFQLPKDFFGGFVTGATMSNFTCLAVARQWIGKQIGIDVAKEGLTKGVKVVAATPHSSSIKSLSMLGIGSNNLVKIATEVGNREAIDVVALEDYLQKNPTEPIILISSAGTVNTVDFDDFKAIAKLKEKYSFWWHIDAAFGGFAACSSPYQHLVEDWEQSDSITIDCHKWLNVPYESAVFFVKQKHSLLQVETFQNSNAPYLGNPLENFNYLNFLPENSRRLKALSVWFSLVAYGQEGIRSIVDDNISHAAQFGKGIETSLDFELLAPVRLNTVCFTLRKETNPDEVTVFLRALNATGKVFMTPTLYKDRKGIRAAFVNWRTTTDDVNLVLGLMDEVINQLRNGH